MPILIKNYTWSQNSNEIILKVPIKGIIRAKIDIFIFENLVKINFSPYYFEVFLLNSVDEKESRCRLMEDEAIFYLRKKEKIDWTNLEINVDKLEKIKVKEQVQKQNEERLITERKERTSMKEEIKREEIRKQIERDTNTREAIETFKKSASNKEMVAIDNWSKFNLKTKNQSTAQNITMGTRPTKSNSLNEDIGKSKNIPGIRNPGNITVTFSKRNFATPQRESQESLEMEWLTKQHEARKSVGFIEEDLSPEERNPKWLKNKGDDFFTKKNYLAAISAYSTAIRITDKYFELYLNRSAAHFAIGNYQRCVEDCTKAYERLTPAVQSNLIPRIQCLTRRGNGLFKLGFIKQAYQEIVEALKLSPFDEMLKRDAEMMRCTLERSVTN